MSIIPIPVLFPKGLRSICGANASFSSSCDFAQDWQLGFQDPASPIMEGIVDLHHDIMFLLFIIRISVSHILLRTVTLSHSSKNNFLKIVHGKVIEIVWTITPSLILAVIAIPSLASLYSMDEVIDPAVTLKAVGHQ
jgi:cytochrome c oxidase subunit 2